MAIKLDHLDIHILKLDKMNRLNCETLNVLVSMGAFKGKCPWISSCVRNLPGDKCELALTCEANDTSKLPEINIIPVISGGSNSKELK